jgi:hypothetical protein
MCAVAVVKLGSMIRHTGDMPMTYHNDAMWKW